MKLKTNVKASGIGVNHNETSGLRVKSMVKAGGATLNHNQSA